MPRTLPAVPGIFGILIAIGLTCASASGEQCRSSTASSGPQQVPLIELYTSEGCSSCPPADNWLSGIATSGIHSHQIVALAFHVDYWNYLGWQDRFANPEFSERQRLKAAQAGNNMVYTPQIMLNGHDWRPGNYADLQHLAQSTTASTTDISLNIQEIDGGAAVTVDAKTRTLDNGGELFIALFENKLQSSITAGENAGRHLNHDAVVRKLLGPFTLPPKGHIHIEKQIEFAAGQRGFFSGIAAWVEEAKSGKIVQAIASSCGSPR